jgi:hypothetical protein
MEESGRNPKTRNELVEIASSRSVAITPTGLGTWVPVPSKTMTLRLIGLCMNSTSMLADIG